MSQPESHRQRWIADFNGPIPSGQCVCGAAWTPAHQGDTPGSLAPGEADVPPAVDLATRIDRVENLVGRLLGAAATGFVDIAKALVAAANEAKEITLPEVLRARIAAEDAAHPPVMVHGDAEVARLRRLVGDEDYDRERWQNCSRSEAIRQANEFHDSSLRWMGEHDLRRDERDQARADRDQLHAEAARVAAERDAMRPVVEAAKAWRRKRYGPAPVPAMHEEFFSAQELALIAAVDQMAPVPASANQGYGCPKCGSILNAKAANCDGEWHADNRPAEVKHVV